MESFQIQVYIRTIFRCGGIRPPILVHLSKERFIEVNVDLKELQKTARQGGYRSHNKIGIQEAFANLEQATA